MKSKTSCSWLELSSRERQKHELARWLTAFHTSSGGVMENVGKNRTAMYREVWSNTLSAPVLHREHKWDYPIINHAPTADRYLLILGLWGQMLTEGAEEDCLWRDQPSLRNRIKLLTFLWLIRLKRKQMPNRMWRCRRRAASLTRNHS